CVVPGQLRDRLRQLLQPAVVREAAVEDRRIVSERNFESFGWGLGAGGWTRRRHADVPWRERRVRNHAVVQPAAPRGIVFGIDLPELANEVVARPLRPVAHRGEHFVRALAAVERGDQRLDDRRARVRRKCASGICQWHSSDVSSSYRLRCARSCTLPIALAKARSTGAVYTGLPPIMTSRSTL